MNQTHLLIERIRSYRMVEEGSLQHTEREGDIEIWRYGDINVINDDYCHCSLLSTLLPKICLSAAEKVSEQYVKIMKGDTVIL